MSEYSSATSALIDRMLTFQPGTFDGYPSMYCTDEALIHNALEEYRAGAMGSSSENLSDVPFLTNLASNVVTTRNQYESAKAFIAAHVAALWDCNMSEGGNEVHEQVMSA